MKSLKIFVISCLIVACTYVFSSSFVAADNLDIPTIVSSVESYYTKFDDYVEWKTDSIWFKRIRIKIEDRIWNTLLAGIQRKLTNLDGEQKIIFQTLWSKISQRKDTNRYTTSDLIVQWELINLINNFRTEQGLWQLTYNTLLTKAAYNHANDMYLHFPYDTNWDWIKENLSHVGTDWSRVNMRVENLWYGFSFVAENIAYNQTQASQVLLDRKNSPTHYANLIAMKAKDIWVAKLWSYWVLVLWAQRQND